MKKPDVMVQIPAWGSQRQEDPWVLLASQLSLNSELQVNERPCLEETVDSCLRDDTQADFWPARAHTCTYTRMCTCTCLCEHQRTTSGVDAHLLPFIETGSLVIPVYAVRDAYQLPWNLLSLPPVLPQEQWGSQLCFLMLGFVWV